MQKVTPRLLTSSPFDPMIQKVKGSIGAAKMLSAILTITLILLLSGGRGNAITAQTMPECWYRYRAAMERGNFRNASRWADSCLTIRPIRYQFLMAKGIALYRLNRYNLAIEYLLKAEKKRKGCASIWLARAYCRLNDSARCIEWVEQNLSSRYRAKESEILLDKCFEKAMRSPKWDKIWKKEHYSRVDRTQYEAEYLNSVHSWEESLELLNSRIKGKKSRYMLYALRGDAYLNLGNFSAAQDNYHIAYKRSKGKAEYLAKIATAQYKRKLYGAALKSINRAIKKSGGDPKFFLIKATIEKEVALWDSAYYSIKHYLSFYPDDIGANELLAKSGFHSGNFIPALLSLAKLIALYPENYSYRLLRAKIYLKGKNYRVALVDLDSTIAGGYRIGEAYYYRGLCQLMLGNKTEGCSNLSTSVHRGYFKAQELFHQQCSSRF